MKANRLLIVDAHQSLIGAPGAISHPAMGYSPYGWRKHSGALPSIGFNGQRAEPVTNAYLLGHGYRGYSSTLMRFHKPDRLSPFAEGGLNAYAYCHADPVNRRDPNGAADDWVSEAQPYATLLVNLLMLSFSFYTLRTARPPLAKPLPPLVSAGTMTSMGASTAAITATVLLLAGVDEGRTVSFFGTLGSAGALAMRFLGTYLARRAQKALAKKALKDAAISQGEIPLVPTDLSGSKRSSINVDTASRSPSLSNRQIRTPSVSSGSIRNARVSAGEKCEGCAASFSRKISVYP